MSFFSQVRGQLADHFHLALDLALDVWTCIFPRSQDKDKAAWRFGGGGGVVGVDGSFPTTHQLMSMGTKHTKS